ncbi:MAG: glucosaminidase domain-containing protein [Spirochaetales bacterium]|nr:glucosaminidase domain-containing protein [Spirochaetales bacterium]
MIRKFYFFILPIVFLTNLWGINENIYSAGESTQETLAHLLSSGNRSLGQELVNEFAQIYIEEAKKEGINWDIAFSQMCLETGFLKFGGLVISEQNNFCGLGSFDNKQGASFPTIREGVRAHIQHLKAYSSTDKLNGDLIDPRFHYVQRGSATTIHQLAGKWAEDPKYGKKILSLLKRVDLIERTNLVLNASAPTGFEAPVKNKTEDLIPEPQESGWLR